MPMTFAQDEAPLPADVLEALAARDIAEMSEIALRRALEAFVPGYNLYRLTPAAQKRWKCRDRLMLDAGFYDGKSVAEVYARALLAVMSTAPAATSDDQSPSDATE